MPKPHETRRQGAQQSLVANSFQHVTDAPAYKASFKGSQQGTTSYIPYRSSTPPKQPDALNPDDRQAPARRSARTTEESTDVVPYRPGIPWKRCFVAAAVICYLLYAAYTSWVHPFLTNLSHQWHYGDARVSHTSMTINSKQRDLLGIGYKGQVEVVLLPDPKDPTAQATIYIDPQPLTTIATRAVILHPAYVNSDPYLDILVEVEGTQGVSPVLYGKPDGSFQWNSPPEKGA
jgi:hypothetical protein